MHNVITHAYGIIISLQVIINIYKFIQWLHKKKQCSVFRTMRADVNVVGFLVLCFLGVQQWDYKEIRATFISHHIL